MRSRTAFALIGESMSPFAMTGMRTACLTSRIVRYSACPEKPHARVRSDLQRDRYVYRRDDGGKDFGDPCFVAQQRGARCLVTDLLGRAAHVDIDDLGATIDIELSRLRHQPRFGSQDLGDTRFRLSVKITLQQRLAMVP